MDTVEGIVSFNPGVFPCPASPLEVSLTTGPAFASPYHIDLITVVVGDGTITMGVAYPICYIVYSWTDHDRKMQESLAGVIEDCPTEFPYEENMIFISTDLESLSNSVSSEVSGECPLLLQCKNH